jgi:glutaryl-CoA dehydrogenase
MLHTYLVSGKMHRPLVRSSNKKLAAALPLVVARCLTNEVAYSFRLEDPLNANSLLTDEELAISEVAESYCQKRMLPRVLRRCMNYII